MLKKCSLLRAKTAHGDIGVISINRQGEFGISFHSERMHRAWMNETGKVQIAIY